MKFTVGYCVSVQPELASFRLRVAIPAPHVGLPYQIGGPGEISFFYKQGNVDLADSLMGPIVYDVVNDHFHDSQREAYLGMCARAAQITCGSWAMADTIKRATGRTAVVIDDPYENLEQEPACKGETVLWFGHAANLSSLAPHMVEHLRVCSNVGWAVQWTRRDEDRELDNCAVVLLTSANPGASANRVVKALRAGRFVVAPADCPEAWRPFDGYMWIGDVEEGIAWAKANREEACRKVKLGQDWIRHRYNPLTIGAVWRSVFDKVRTARSDSTLAVARNATTVGSA